MGLGLRIKNVDSLKGAEIRLNGELYFSIVEVLKYDRYPTGIPCHAASDGTRRQGS